MKKLILLAGAATLAACTPNEGDNATNEEAVEETAMEDAAPEGPGMIGTYTVYTAEGEMAGTFTTAADGTYAWTGADGVNGGGTWENRDGMMCADETEAEGAEDPGPRCWTPGETGEDGRQMWTSDDEEPMISYTTYAAA